MILRMERVCARDDVHLTGPVQSIRRVSIFVIYPLTGVRDYIHVVDLAKGHVSAVKKLDQLAISPKGV